MRAILIDPFHKTVKEIQIHASGGDSCLLSIKTAIGCEMITSIPLPEGTLTLPGPKRNALFLDDEGLYREGQRYFSLPHYHQPLAGKAVAVGIGEEGETKACTLSLVAMRMAVSWLKVRFVGTRDAPPHEEMLFGQPFTVLSSTALFEPAEEQDGDGSPH
jgi:hypothetical protein